ncbi:hypothetical protein [Corynebacterium lubricantis]|uniref:hypothetical protein n=1 Tax=Corynebacterium lubricantis TaxID=541095 RepID=UPI00037B5588|nr:hypothetical protein [Corynebacterium lubricantis]
MHIRKIAAGTVAIALSVGAFSAPQALAVEPGNEPVTSEELEQGAQEISFESSKGSYITPGETITLTADTVGEGIQIRNAYVETAAGETSVKWKVARSVNDEGLPVLTITAPDAPENQSGAIQEYGEYKVHIRTSNWNSYLFEINFAAEHPAETPEFSSSELSSQFNLPDFSELFGLSSR